MHSDGWRHHLVADWGKAGSDQDLIEVPEGELSGPCSMPTRAGLGKGAAEIGKCPPQRTTAARDVEIPEQEVRFGVIHLVELRSK